MANAQEKIKKLLRLSQQRDSVEEAAVAFGQAQRLATIHSLNLDDILLDELDADSHPPPEEVEDIVGLVIVKWNRVVVWKASLIGYLALANRCKRYWWPGHGGSCVAYGQISDVNTVKYMFDAIAPQIERLAREAVNRYTNSGQQRLTGVSGRSYGRSFRIGAVDAIGKKLKPAPLVLDEVREEVDEARLAAGSDHNALAVSTNALARVCAAEDMAKRIEEAIEAWTVKNNFKVKTVRLMGARNNSGYADGRLAGETVRVSNSRAKSLGSGEDEDDDGQ